MDNTADIFSIHIIESQQNYDNCFAITKIEHMKGETQIS